MLVNFECKPAIGSEKAYKGKALREYKQKGQTEHPTESQILMQIKYQVDKTILECFNRFLLQNFV